jgi:drug/metabolite transporter (DMT)-like permease
MVLKSPKSAIALLLFVSFVWGAEFVLVDMAIEKIPTHAFNALRFFLAGCCLLPLLKLEAPQPQESHKTLVTGLLLGFLLFIGFATQTEGLHYTSVSNAGFITGLNVPFVPLLGFLIFRSHVALSGWIGVVAATVGLYFLTIGDKLSFNNGDILILICAIAFAAHIIMTGHFASALPAIRLSIIQMFAVAGYSALASTGLELGTDFYQTPLKILSDPIVASAIVIAAVLGSALAYWAQTASQKILQPHQVALIFAAEPLFAHATAAIFLGETLGFQGWLGAGLIVAGMLISELGDKKHPAEVHAIDQSAAPKNY